MAPKPSHDTLIHCEACGEDYSSTYRNCPFCGARNAPKRTSGRSDPKTSSRYIPTPPPAQDKRDPRDELDDTYIFDGQDAFDDEPEEEYYAPRKGGKRLAPKEGGFDMPPVNWPRLITFLCSLIIIVAALIIVFTYVYPKLHKDKKPDPSASASVEPTPSPTPFYTPEPTPDVTDPVEPSVDPVDTTPVGTPATVVNASGGLRLRSGPGTTYDILGSLYNGDAITVLDPAENGWYNIEYKGIKGYIMGDYISTISGGGSTTTTTPPPTVTTTPPPATTQTPTSGGPTTGRTGTIVGADGGLRVRSGPGTSYEVLTSLFNGQTVTVVADAGGGWYEISYSGAGGAPTRGYIMGQYISTN